LVDGRKELKKREKATKDKFVLGNSR
jgi:hypothetical protein